MMRFILIALMAFGVVAATPMLSRPAAAQIACPDDSTRCQGTRGNPFRFFNDIGEGNLNDIRECDVCDAIALRQCANLSPTLPPGLSPVTGPDANLLLLEYNSLVTARIFDRGTIRDQCRNRRANQALLDDVWPFISPD